MSYSNGNDDFKNFIADELEQIQFHLKIIAKKFIDYENNKEKKGLMNNIGCHFSIIENRLELIIDHLKK